MQCLWCDSEELNTGRGVVRVYRIRQTTGSWFGEDLKQRFKKSTDLKISKTKWRKLVYLAQKLCAEIASTATKLYFQQNNVNFIWDRTLSFYTFLPNFTQFGHFICLINCSMIKDKKKHTSSMQFCASSLCKTVGKVLVWWLQYQNYEMSQ